MAACCARKLPISTRPRSETSGIDLEVSYSFDANALGLLSAKLGLSHTLDYDITLEDGTSIDGVGSRNAGNAIGRPLPQYKANLVLGWLKGRHSASLTVRHVDEFEDDDVPQSALRGAYIGFAETIESMTTLDVQYEIDFPVLGLESASSALTLGVKNAGNEAPPWSMWMVLMTITRMTRAVASGTRGTASNCRGEAQLRAGAKKPRADEGGTPEGRGPGWPEFTSPLRDSSRVTRRSAPPQLGTFVVQ